MNNLKFVIGASITKGGESFADYGLCYSNLSKEDVVKIESILAKHSASMMAGMDAVVRDLVALGYEQVEQQNTPQAGPPPGAIR